MYCVKCKKQTNTINEQFTTSKNNRHMKRGTCVVCGTTKTQFIKAQKGGSLLNKFINNLPVEMHLPGHNFTGPGTKLNKRLNSDLTPKKWSKPINRVDKAAYHHDVCYLKNNNTATRNAVCDKNMLKELKGIYNPTIREKMERGLVSSLIDFCNVHQYRLPTTDYRLHSGVFSNYLQDDRVHKTKYVHILYQY